MSEYTDQDKNYTQCAKCAEPLEPNNQGALDISYNGGYGDFVDNYDGETLFFRLCHKHAHQFTNWLGNPSAIHPSAGHSHNGAEKGFWYGHIGWDQKTWLSYVNGFFYHWIKKSFRSAVSYVKHHFKSHKQWTRQDINDSSSPVVLSSFFFSLFFLTNAYKGKVNKLKRLYNAKKILLAESIYRDSTSLYSEIWTKSVNGKLSESEISLIKDLGEAFTSLEEE